MNLQPFNYFLLLPVIFTLASGAEDKVNWPETLNLVLNKCLSISTNFKGPKPPFVDLLRSCLQHRTLTAVDAVLSADVIPVINGLNLVRYKKDKVNVNQQEKNETGNARASGNSWREKVFGRFAEIFKTHVLKIDIDRLTGATNSISQTARENKSDAVVEGRRHHRRRNQLMPMLMIGVMVIGSVLIPMGFQFLAVLGGKALILAKLALLLSSIQGLKKVATSGMNYGLYHSPVSEGWHDRSHHELTTHYEIPYPVYSRS